LVIKVPDPLRGSAAACRKVIRLPIPNSPLALEVENGHVAVLTAPGVGQVLIGPGTYELARPGGQADICWVRVGPLGGPGGKPMICAVPITEARTRDGYCVGLLCEFTVRVWEPELFRDAFLPKEDALGLWELEEAVRPKVMAAMAEALTACDVEGMKIAALGHYLRHYANLHLKDVGLRLANLGVRAKAILGPVRDQEELLKALEKGLPLPLDAQRASELERKAKLVAEKPWIAAKPLNPAWVPEWKEFWASLALDYMWSKGRFLLKPSDLASIGPFSALKEEWREELIDYMKEVIGSEEGLIFSAEVLERLSSALLSWAYEKGLYVLDTGCLGEFMGLSERETRMVLERLVRMGACEWLERGRSVLLLPRSS